MRNIAAVRNNDGRIRPHHHNNNKIVIDVIVANCQIRALKPKDEYQTMLMPNTDTEKLVWWNSVRPR